MLAAYRSRLRRSSTHRLDQGGSRGLRMAAGRLDRLLNHPLMPSGPVWPGAELPLSRGRANRVVVTNPRPAPCVRRVGRGSASHRLRVHGLMSWETRPWLVGLLASLGDPGVRPGPRDCPGRRHRAHRLSARVSPFGKGNTIDSGWRLGEAIGPLSHRPLTPLSAQVHSKNILPDSPSQSQRLLGLPSGSRKPGDAT
jgi:hypothetical protein